MLRVIKGAYDDPEIRVRSGPIPSCMGPFHVRFTVAETRIFLLRMKPARGVAQLAWQGSIRPVLDTELIEHCLLRARAVKARHLEEMKRDSPGIYAEALALRDRLREASKRWPDPEPEGSEFEPRPAVRGGRAGEPDPPSPPTRAEMIESASEALAQELAEIDVEAIRVALAMAWLDGAERWVGHVVWREAMRVLGDLRKDEIAAAERSSIRRTLAEASVEERHVEEYLAAIEDRDLAREIVFPHSAPYAYRDRQSDVLTTDLILRWHLYDRGAVFRDFGMDFDRLATLEPERLSAVMPAMYGSADEQVHLVAYRAIEAMPGTDFFHLLLADIMDGKEFSWRATRRRKDQEASAARLAALIDLAERTYAAWGRAAFWRALARGECFERAAVDAAIARLGGLEDLGEFDGGEDHEADADEKRVREALTLYLSAARRSRAPEDGEPVSAAGWAAWFDAHPSTHEGP